MNMLLLLVVASVAPAMVAGSNDFGLKFLEENKVGARSLVATRYRTWPRAAFPWLCLRAAPYSPAPCPHPIGNAPPIAIAAGDSYVPVGQGRCHHAQIWAPVQGKLTKQALPAHSDIRRRAAQAPCRLCGITCGGGRGSEVHRCPRRAISVHGVRRFV